MPLPAFRFKKFKVEQAGAAHPVGTDAVLLGAWAAVQGATNFLDIGTGTGVIALMLAQRMEKNQPWNGLGVELHPPSAALARENFVNSPWANRLALWEDSIQNFLKHVQTHGSMELSEIFKLSESWPSFDLIVSNPPFFSQRTVSPDKTRSLGRHTATLSPEELLEAAARLLAPGGRFCVILPTMEGRQFCELAVQQGLYWTHITEVRSRPDKPVERLLLQFEKSPYPFRRDEMCLYAGKSGGEYSEDFQALTRAFYL